MDALYLIPVETNNGGMARGPKYFQWRYDPDPPGIVCAWGGMDYGFMPTYLLYSPDISDADHAALIAHPDVYSWPTNLDVSIPGGDAIKAFCEGINIPTDWTTAATTYRQLLRCMAGMFQFMQRYGGISGGAALLGGSVTLATRYRNLTVQQQGWFDATVTSFGYPASIINQNSTLRQMLKQAGDAWGVQPFKLGGMEF